MTYSFVSESLPSRVVFGPGTLQELPEELHRLGAKRALVLCTPQQRDMVADIVVMLGAHSAGVFDGAVMHVPAEIAATARDKAKRVGADCCVAIGGGSTTGLAKAIALTSGLQILAIPTAPSATPPSHAPYSARERASRFSGCLTISRRPPAMARIPSSAIIEIIGFASREYRASTQCAMALIPLVTERPTGKDADKTGS